METKTAKSSPGRVLLTIFLFVSLFGIAFAISLFFTKGDKGPATENEVLPEAQIVLPKDTPTPEVLPSLFPTPVSNKPGEGCKIGGCNGEICLNENDEVATSICLYKETYACYTNAKCEKQSDGKCGWTQTKALKICLESKDKNEEIFCGGIAAKTCPEGYTCVLDGSYPDAGGKCVKEKQ